MVVKNISDFTKKRRSKNAQWSYHTHNNNLKKNPQESAFHLIRQFINFFPPFLQTTSLAKNKKWQKNNNKKWHTPTMTIIRCSRNLNFCCNPWKNVEPSSIRRSHMSIHPPPHYLISRGIEKRKCLIKMCAGAPWWFRKIRKRASAAGMIVYNIQYSSIS